MWGHLDLGNLSVTLIRKDSPLPFSDRLYKRPTGSLLIFSQGRKPHTLNGFQEIQSKRAGCLWEDEHTTTKVVKHTRTHAPKEPGDPPHLRHREQPKQSCARTLWLGLIFTGRFEQMPFWGHGALICFWISEYVVPQRKKQRKGPAFCAETSQRYL